MRKHKRRYKLLLAIGYWLIAYPLYSQINSDSLISVYTQKMKKYLDKENKASEVFSFTKEGIEVYAPATDTSQRKFEFIINWDEKEWLKDLLSFTDFNHERLYKIFLKKGKGEILDTITFEETHYGGCDDCIPKIFDGKRIALDPGHIAGDLETAKREKKWVEMKNPQATLIEGELTLATALILKKKLEDQGAHVMLTRDKPNQSAFGVDYKKWKDSLFVKSLDSAYARGDISFEEKNYLLHKANDTEIFRRFFMLEDVRERARKINEFHPDLTLIIHYNVDETNQSWDKPTKKDYVMGFVGGSFAKDELDKPEARIDFLRLLLTDDVEHSIEFSKYIVGSLSEKLKVPAALDSNAIYLRDNCMQTEANGVFCRNLTLTRMVRGTLCYGESLYQDNINECKLLSKKEIKVDGMQTSKRVEEVAEAYFQGILNYIKSKK
ncbi:MAG: N-acetylmuramoyl-L-alanine amidase [Bacteroidia bacterium]